MPLIDGNWKKKSDCWQSVHHEIIIIDFHWRLCKSWFFFEQLSLFHLSNARLTLLEKTTAPESNCVELFHWKKSFRSNCVGNIFFSIHTIDWFSRGRFNVQQYAIMYLVNIFEWLFFFQPIKLQHLLLDCTQRWINSKIHYVQKATMFQ